MYKYDIAISYDSGNRKFVKEVVDYLKSDGLEIFFDVEKKLDLLSENLKNKLYQIYQNESLIKVLFVTEEYLKSPYTLLESRCALRSTKDNPRRLIVINFVGDNIQENFKPYVYVDGNTFADEIAYFVGERVKEFKGKPQENNTKKESISHGTKNLNLVETNHGIIAGDNVQISHIHFK